MKNKMKRNESFCYSLLLFYLLSNLSVGLSQKGRKNVYLMEDIQRTVNLILTSVERNSERNAVDWPQRLSSIENSILAISNRVEKIIDSIENNKLNNKLVDERLDRLESKINSIEESMTNKFNAINGKVEQIITDMKSGETVTDGKLRKLMNIISDTYQLNKEITISIKGRQGGAVIGGGDDNDNDGRSKIDEMQKKLLEQLSIVETAIVSQLSNVDKLGKQTLTSIDTINVEMISLRDECHAQRTQQRNNRNYDSSYDEIYSSDKNGGNSQAMQCPNVNISGIQREISYKYDLINNRIGNEITKLETKINEFSNACNNNGRTIQTEPIIVANSSHVVRPIPQLVTLRKTINPADKPTPRSGCQHSSVLLAPKSCAELHRSGSNCDGVYVITVANFKMIRVYCDMNDDGGGWTVILRRGEFGRNRHSVSFDHDWNGYKGGFGDVDNGEFWLGLENIHKLTSQEDNILQVDLESFDGDYVSVVYDSFRVGSEADNYKLHLGKPMQPNAKIAESFLAHNSSMFTTRDENNGISDDNCASKLSGGWWFHNCHSAFLTAPYFRQNERQHQWQGMQWHSWKRADHLKAAQMKIRAKQ